MNKGVMVRNASVVIYMGVLCIAWKIIVNNYNSFVIGFPWEQSNFNGFRSGLFIGFVVAIISFVIGFVISRCGE